MLGRARKFRIVLQTTAIITLAASATLANQSIRAVVVAPARLCYCGCPEETGFTHCTKMCQLPQYLNRWWATNCQRTQLPSLKPHEQSPAPDSHSRKTNYIEDALREQ